MIDLQFAVIDLQFAVIGLQFAVIDLQFAVIDLQNVSLLWNDLQPINFDMKDEKTLIQRIFWFACFISVINTVIIKFFYRFLTLLRYVSGDENNFEGASYKGRHHYSSRLEILLSGNYLTARMAR